MGMDATLIGRKQALFLRLDRDLRTAPPVSLNPQKARARRAALTPTSFADELLSTQQIRSEVPQDIWAQLKTVPGRKEGESSVDEDEETCVTDDSVQAGAQGGAVGKAVVKMSKRSLALSRIFRTKFPK